MRLLLLLSLPLLAVSVCPPPGSSRPCWDRIKENDRNRDPDGGLPPGGEDPECDSNGRFLPKQCSGAECYCVNPHGHNLPCQSGKRYATGRWMADDMKCNCAIEEFNNEGIIGPQTNCDDIGNYHHTQCTGTSCYCVDKKTGERRIGSESNIADIRELEKRCASGRF